MDIENRRQKEEDEKSDTRPITCCGGPKRNLRMIFLG
jgi:hypothetical protein